jgi:hypothetical protein
MSPQRRRNRQVLSVCSSEEAITASHWSSELIDVCVTVPTSMVVMQGGFPFADGWNPFVDSLRGGRGELARYYRDHTPRTLAEMYRLDVGDRVGGNCSPRLLPWLGDEREVAVGEMGLGPDHGVSLYGPVSPEKLDLEWGRLTETRNSIAAHGYQPEYFEGDINGQFLLAGDSFRFFVRGGKHRAAALASLGREEMTVTFRPGWTRAVDVSQHLMWPPVVTGQVSAEVAAAVFDRYFDNSSASFARELGPARRAEGVLPRA